MKTVILLEGTSSVGKTTLALAIQEIAEFPLYRLSVDDFFHMVPQKIMESRNGYNLAEYIEQIVYDFHDLVGFISKNIGKVIVDHIFQKPWWREHFFKCIPRQNVFYVQVYCDLPELESREIKRGDRAPGGASLFFHEIYSFKNYDLQIHSGENLPEECADSVLKAYILESLKNFEND